MICKLKLLTVLTYFTAVFLLSTSTFAIDSGSTTLNDAIRLEINSPFFKALNERVRQTSLQDIINRSYPDERGVSPRGIKYQILGNYFSAKFSDVRVETLDNRLKLSVGIHSINLHISKIKGKRGFIKTTCRKVDLYIGNKLVLPGTVLLTPVIEAGGISFKAEDVTFDIPEDEFVVVGPSSCSGILGGFLKRKLGEFLLTQRIHVVKRIHDRLQEAATQMGAIMANKLQTDQQFKLSSLGAISNQQSTVAQLYPNRLLLNSDGLSLSFAANFPVALPTKSFDHLSNFVLDDRVNRTNRWGFVGINPTLINTLLQLSLPVNGEFHLLTSQGNLDIDRFFNLEKFSEIIPDLINSNGTQQSIQAHYRFTAPPNFWINTGGLHLYLPTVELALHIWSGREWKPYYHFLLDINPETSILDDEGKIKIVISTSHITKVQGYWADGFPFKNQTVNHQLLAAEVTEILSINDNSLVLTTFSKPKLEFDGVSRRSEPAVTPSAFGLNLF
ncbi:MAG: hypothetical protein HN353_08125 [Bdellovibrionales bacterium]|jgi:hypothetical protein|nr:hypothetical protein [Bdellovibrionales bacterium]MBT3525887.1 hypothetical protein [Bdellovibrionales bacterium]MBT7669852.1 hypothetical protein [Bdellovibrionales bacterium]MBT7766121.1 hypothetical protein [Bdellovibrionales bacterium]